MLQGFRGHRVDTQGFAGGFPEAQSTAGLWSLLTVRGQQRGPFLLQPLSSKYSLTGKAKGSRGMGMGPGYSLRRGLGGRGLGTLQDTSGVRAWQGNGCCLKLSPRGCGSLDIQVRPGLGQKVLSSDLERRGFFRQGPRRGVGPRGREERDP